MKVTSSSAASGGGDLSDSLRSYHTYTGFGRWAAWTMLAAAILLAAIWWAGCNDTTTILPVNDGIFTAVSADDSLECAAVISRTDSTTLILWSHDSARSWDTARFIRAADTTTTLAHTKDTLPSPRLEALTMDWRSGHGIAVGNGGTIALTDDSARTWRILDTQKYVSSYAIEHESTPPVRTVPKVKTNIPPRKVSPVKKQEKDNPSPNSPPSDEQQKQESPKNYKKSSLNEFRPNSSSTIFRTVSYRIDAPEEKPQSNKPDTRQIEPPPKSTYPPKSKSIKEKETSGTIQTSQKPITAKTNIERLRLISFRRVSMDTSGRGIAEAKNGIIRITNDFGKTWQGDSVDGIISRSVAIADWRLNKALLLANNLRYGKRSADSVSDELNRLVSTILGDFRFTTRFKPVIVLAAGGGLTNGRYCYSFIDTAKHSFIRFDTVSTTTFAPVNIALSPLYFGNKLAPITDDTTLLRVRALSCNHLTGQVVALMDSPNRDSGSKMFSFSGFGATLDTAITFPKTLYALTMDWQSGRGLAVGAGGTIVRTTDSIRTWQEIKPYRRSEQAEILSKAEPFIESVEAIFCVLTLALVWQRRRLRRRIEIQRTGDPAEENVLALLSDNPSDTDKLGFSDTRDAIIGLMNNPDTEPPVNIVINGEWGSGKTSLMAQIKRKIDANENNISLWFNAWHFQSENHTLSAFLTQLAKALERGYDGQLRWKFQLFLQRFRTLGIIRKGIFLGSLVPVFILGCTLLLSLEPISSYFGRKINNIILHSLGVASSDNSPLYELLKRTGEFFTGILGLGDGSGLNTPEFASIITLTTSLVGGYFIRREWGSTLETFFKILNINTILGKEQSDKAPDTGQRDTFKREFWNIINASDPSTKLVIFIDDLDRVSGEKIKELLEAINFITDTASKPPGSEEKQSKVYFVIGMSLNEVVHNLDELLGEKTDSRGEVVSYGSRYIEKMVDIVINIPEPNTTETVLIRNIISASEASKNDSKNDVIAARKPSIFSRIGQMGMRFRRSAYTFIKAALPYSVATLIVFQFTQLSPSPNGSTPDNKSSVTKPQSPENKQDTMMITIVKSGRNWPDSLTIGFIRTSSAVNPSSDKTTPKTQTNTRYSRPSDTAAYEAILNKLHSIKDSVKAWDSAAISQSLKIRRKTSVAAGEIFSGGNGWKGIFILPLGVFVWLFWASDRKRHPDDEEIDDGGADPEELVQLFRRYNSAIKDLLHTPRKMKRFANRIRLQYNLLGKRNISLAENGQTALFFEMMLLLESNRAIFALDRATFIEHVEKRIRDEYSSAEETSGKTSKRPMRFHHLPSDGKFSGEHLPLLDELYKLNSNTQV